MNNRKVLISGAGIGGLTLAYFLQKNGYQPVVIEKAESLRHNGYMIDFFSSGVFVSEQMDILEDLKNRDYNIQKIRQYNKQGKKDFSVDISLVKQKIDGGLFSFLRTDLIDVLYQKVKHTVEIRFSTSIKNVHQDDNSVSINFEDGTSENFDLLFGADGIHSKVRKLLYKDSEVNKIFLGYYVAAVEHNVENASENDELFCMLAPKRQVMTYEVEKRVYNTLFAFQSALLPDLSPKEQIEMLNEKYSSFKGAVPEILKEVAKKDKLYFDQVTQIRLNTSWHKGRTVLIGDAAYCITLLSGQGASMAMTGAYLLAEKLKKHSDNYAKAFSEFESKLRPKVQTMQKKAAKNTATYVPGNWFTLKVRNTFAPLLFSKLFVPLLIKQIGAQNFFNK